MQIIDVTRQFPAEWRTPAEVYRRTTDRYGNTTEEFSHTIEDCLISTQESDEEPQSRSVTPDTTAFLYTPAGVDILSSDHIKIPPSMYWPSGDFQVDGEPDRTPLGTRVPLRRP